MVQLDYTTRRKKTRWRVEKRKKKSKSIHTQATPGRGHVHLPSTKNTQHNWKLCSINLHKEHISIDATERFDSSEMAPGVYVNFISHVTSRLGLQEEEEPQTAHVHSMCVSYRRYHADGMKNSTQSTINSAVTGNMCSRI